MIKLKKINFTIIIDLMLCGRIMLNTPNIKAVNFCIIGLFFYIFIAFTSFPALAETDSTGAVNISGQDLLISGSTDEVSVSIATDLKISELKCKKVDNEYVLTWKTNTAPCGKSKIVFWTTDQPCILDPSFTIDDTTGVFLHRYSIKALKTPEKFVKIRLSYIISEDAGAYADIRYENIIIEKKN